MRHSLPFVLSIKTLYAKVAPSSELLAPRSMFGLAWTVHSPTASLDAHGVSLNISQKPTGLSLEWMHVSSSFQACSQLGKD